LLYQSQLAEVEATAFRFRIKGGKQSNYHLERLEMALRNMGFNQLDFCEMTLPELYLRYCLQAENIKEK
jgi:hypothetical protein